jgi:hypothetical protein
VSGFPPKQRTRDKLCDPFCTEIKNRKLNAIAQQTPRQLGPNIP